jgi:hypothetical protein
MVCIPYLLFSPLSNSLNLLSTSPKFSLKNEESSEESTTNIQIGNHACPGRFFAGIEIKVILIELLRGWDFRNVGDTEMKGGGRPENFCVDISISPNPVAEIEFKRRV